MLAAISRHYALRILISRALVLFVLITLIVSAFRIDSPLGVVLLVAALGWVDLRRRRELLFWANLGYGAAHTTAVFGGVALACETLFAVVLRPMIATAIQNAR